MTLKHGLASYETALKYKHLNNGNSLGNANSLNCQPNSKSYGNNANAALKITF